MRIENFFNGELRIENCSLSDSATKGIGFTTSLLHYLSTPLLHYSKMNAIHKQLSLLCMLLWQLVALAAGGAVCDSCASTISLDTAPICGLPVGETSDWIYATFTRNDTTDNFTNIQFEMTMPQGLQVLGVTNTDTDTEGSLSTRGSNNAESGKYIVLMLNTMSEGDYIKITKNPLTLCRMKLKKTSELPPNATIEITRLRYTDYNNGGWAAPDRTIDIAGEAQNPEATNQ